MELDLMLPRRLRPIAWRRSGRCSGDPGQQRKPQHGPFRHLPEDFYKDSNRKIIERIAALVDKGLPSTCSP